MHHLNFLECTLNGMLCRMAGCITVAIVGHCWFDDSADSRRFRPDLGHHPPKHSTTRADLELPPNLFCVCVRCLGGGARVVPGYSALDNLRDMLGLVL